MDDLHDTTHEREHLWNLIRDIRFCMFTTRHANGHLHSRPMTTQNRAIDEDRTLWFFMSRAGSPIEDLMAEPTVNVTYADPGADTYVSISGEAAVVQDRARKAALWTKMAEAWFPKGPDDPDLALVQLNITHADYWDVKDSKIKQFFKMAKAAVTGRVPTDMGEHGKVRMQ